MAKNIYEDEMPVHSIGSAAPAQGADDAEYPAAHLWLPDPGSHHGWYTRDVKRRPAHAPTPRAGFRLPPR